MFLERLFLQFVIVLYVQYCSIAVFQRRQIQRKEAYLLCISEYKEDFSIKAPVLKNLLILTFFIETLFRNIKHL